MNRVSLYDIAKHLGLHASTVSRGLRGHPRIPQATRERIRAACEELGYRPNAALSDLSSCRWHPEKVGDGTVIAFIIRSRPGNVLSHELPANAHRYASEIGYQLQSFHRAEYKSSAHLQRVLSSRGISSIILGSVQEEALTVQFDWSKFICVQLQPVFFPLPLHSVVQDHYNGIVMAWQKAVSRGYKRIGVVLLDHSLQMMDDVVRQSAVYGCQKHLFAHLPALPTFYFKRNDEVVGDFIIWVKTHQPDVIIGFSEGHYHRFYEEFGYHLPYICLHNPGELSGLYEAPNIYIKEAINLLHFCRRIHQWGIPEQRIDHLVEPTWFEGKSLPQKKEA